MNSIKINLPKKGEVLAESLKEYKPEALESKLIHRSSKIGESKTTKFP